MTRTKIVVVLIAVALVVIIGLQNTAGVDARILFYSGTVPLAALHRRSMRALRFRDSIGRHLSKVLTEVSRMIALALLVEPDESIAL
jgi:hypothetical protein